MQLLGDIWNAVIIQPMINSLILLYDVFFNNFGLSIIAFTILVRVVLIPLSIKQARQMKAMTSLQPKLKEIQELYKKDPQKRSSETMRIYKERGVNPIGCLGPFFIQFPIWIGLFWSLRATLPSTPESLARLSGQIYPWLPGINESIPLKSTFLWLDLGSSDPTPILPVLVGLSMFLMQKVTTMPAADPRQASTNRMMLWMLPIMFGFFTTQFESGLALYWVISNIVGMIIQGFVTGWAPLISLFLFWQSNKAKEQPQLNDSKAIESQPEETITDANHRDNSKDNRRGNRTRPKRIRRRARGSRNRRH